MVDGAISVKPVKWQYRGNRGDGEGANLLKVLQVTIRSTY